MAYTSYHYEQEYRFYQQNMYGNLQPQSCIHLSVIQESHDQSTRLLLIRRLREPVHRRHAMLEL